MENPEKTDGGELISSYECDAMTVDNEFMLSKQRYASLTGREQERGGVIAYHVIVTVWFAGWVDIAGTDAKVR